MDGETRAYLDTVLEGLRREIRAGAAETADLRRELRQEMRETAVETRRHFDVVGESIRSDVRAVAEGVAANSEAIERLGTGLRRRWTRALPRPTPSSGWRSRSSGATSASVGTSVGSGADQAVSLTTLKP